jgi:phosphodiesterase/alkaline phosphatase D-like protein
MTDKLNYTTLMTRIQREATEKFARYISRREFIKGVSGGVVAALLAGKFPTRAGDMQSGAALQAGGTLPNGVAAGDTTTTSTVLWAHSTEPGTVTFEYSTTSDFSVVVDTLAAQVTDATLPVKINVEGLTAGTEYFYRVTDAANEIRTGRFKTAAAAGSNGLRFGVSGDWRGELRPYQSIANVVSRELDFFVQHGDTIYADVPSIDLAAAQAETIAEFRVKHNEVYSELNGRNHWADVRASTSIFSTIDDHEVTNDFSGGADPATDDRFEIGPIYINQTSLYTNAMQVYQEYNPLRDETYMGTNDDRMDGRPKLYRYQTYGTDAAIFILDARSFRDEAVPSTDDFFNREALNAYFEPMYAPGRTMLGRQQVEDLKADLLVAAQAGVTWKFIMMPEPVQAMGWFGGHDRWEGWALERNEVLQFIEANNIVNVVFVAADVHTTFINNIAYQTQPFGENIPTRAFEISTGAVAFYPPTGQALVEGAADFGLISDSAFEAYQNASIAEKDEILQDIFNRFVMLFQGFDPVGLEGSPINYELLQGSWVAGHTFGWTEFDITPETQVLTITTYGIPAYSPKDVLNDTAAVLARTPAIINQLRITSQA